MANLPRFLLAGLCLACSAAAASLSDRDLAVTVTRTPASAAIRVSAAVTVDGPGRQVVTVRVTNASDRDLALNRVVAAFPWSAPRQPAALLCTGGWDMGRSEARVWAPDDEDLPDTGSYLLSHAPDGCAFAGFITWRVFNSKLRYQDGRIEVTADGEGRTVRSGETVELERVWLAEGPDWQDLLFAYGARIAAENHIHLNRPGRNVGWSTWDYYGRDWTTAEVEGNLRVLRELVPNADLLQIDGGWWAERGDYFDVRPDLGAGGMAQFARLAHEQGMTAGIHLDGMRGDKGARVAAEHPDYFLHDATGKILDDVETRAGDRLDYTFFDYSNPAACDYMQRVMANVRKAWGYSYFKIDFMRFGLNEFIAPVVKGKAIVPHDRSLTSVERFHRGLAAMRAGMGPDAYFVGCSAVFGPAFGHIDGLRAGADINPQFSQYRKCAVDTSGGFYLQGQVVSTDTDYLVVRAREDQDQTRVKAKVKDGGTLALNEAEMWAHYVALVGGPRLSSDDLMILRPERRALFQFAAGFPASERYVPIDFWAHARDDADAPSVILSQAKGELYLGVFNWSDRPHTFGLRGIAAGVSKVAGSASVHGDRGAAVVGLAARHSSLFRLAEHNFDAVRHALEVDE